MRYFKITPPDGIVRYCIEQVVEHAGSQVFGREIPTGHLDWAPEHMVSFDITERDLLIIERRLLAWEVKNLSMLSWEMLSIDKLRYILQSVGKKTNVVELFELMIKERSNQ